MTLAEKPARPLLVGEDNPYCLRDPDMALYPYPDGSAGWRLAVRIMGLPRAEYLRRFDRVNLCAGRWSAGEARDRAKDLVSAGTPHRPAIVLLGGKVCRAFDVEFAPFTLLSRTALARCAVILPHPSGRSRAWNEPGAFERARAVLRDAGVLPPAEEIARIAAEAARPKCSNCGLPKLDNVCPDCGFDRGQRHAED